ncbi:MULTISPECIES: hypothetical protein [Actinomycetes]|uniref:hypothetical protein n=1 Tax=Micromonospora sp. NPDC005367 TaxID=3155590 RepID=UPI0033A05133
MTTVFDADVTVTMRGVPDLVGLPVTVNSFELVGREVLVQIRQGPPGNPGPQGGPSYMFTWQGDAATFADLAALDLDTTDARKAWRAVDENALYLWTGMEWIRSINAFGALGKQGPPTTLTGTGIAGATGSSAAAALTGSAPNQALSITFPRGATGDQGDPGEAGAISDAADVGDLTSAKQDAVLEWNATASLWQPVPNPRLAGPWAIASGQFTAGSNLNTSPKTIATMTIPSQPVAWRPIVLSGSVGVLTHVASLGDTRVDIEVRMSAIDGPLIGYGGGLGAANNTQVQLYPRFDYPLTPGSTSAVVQPNQTITLYVLARRVVGTGNYTLDAGGAQLVIMAQPLEDQ